MRNYLETKIKILEIENKRLTSTIEANNKEIQEIKNILQTLPPSDSPTPSLVENSIIKLDFAWKINSKAYTNEDKKTLKKVSGGSAWNCTAIGDKTLVKGKINKWAIQVSKMTSSHILVGIVPKNINIEAVENWKKGYITNLNNHGKHNLGICAPYATLEAKEGHIIETVVDLKTGSISFWANGKNLGVFCENIPKDIDYVPFIEIYQEQTEISLL